MKLIHKGLILISVPLAFELFFAFGFSALLKRSTEQINREIQAKQIMAKVSRIHTLLSESTIAASLKHQNPELDIETRYNQTWLQIQNTYKELQRIPETRNRGATVKEIATTIKRFRVFQHYLITTRIDPTEFVSNPAFRNQISSTIVRWFKMRNESRSGTPIVRLIAAEKSSVKRDRGLKPEIALQLKNFLLFGILGDVLLLTVLGVFFGRSIARRLKSIMQTTALLSRNEHLLTPLSGDDELAQLDLLLHSTARRLAETQRFKKQLLSVVCHELKAPLSAVQLTLSLVATDTAELQSDGKSAVAEAEQQCSQLQKMVTELLAMETKSAAIKELQTPSMESPTSDGSSPPVQQVEVAPESTSGKNLPSRKWQFRLREKGLLLMGLPLVAQILLVGSLAILLQQANQQLEKQTLGRKITEEAQLTIQETADAAILVLACRGDEDITPLYRKQEATITNAIRALKESCSGDPDRSTESLQIEKQVSAISRMQLDLIEESRLHEPKTDIVKQARYADHWRSLSEHVGNLVAHEEKLEAAGTKSLSMISKSLDRLIILGVSMNVISAAALALFLTKNITSRLATVRSNAERILSQEELLPKINGADEISDLDSAFHEAARLLSQEQLLKQRLLVLSREELRTPLETMRNIMCALLEQRFGALSEKTLKRITRAQSATERLVALIDDILDIEKMDAGRFILQMSNMSTRALVMRAETCVRPLAETKQITIQTSVEEQVVFVDPDRVIQVMVNLLSNAIKFSPSQTTVTVSGHSNGEHMLISVEDCGRGIAPELIDKIFDRFSVASDRASNPEGTGLGLSISKAIIEQHGGAISVQSVPNRGTKFQFNLPIAKSL
ncbi:MAG: hypothetical protein K2W95_16445 [Candidatus Obscuribacterales bacterium]|nr:hypothetical protein [Candidatus Obscuribacterales bacterium]